MSTDSVRTRFYDRRPIGLVDFRDRIVGYVTGELKATVARVYSIDGAFGSQITVAPAATANRVDVAPAAAWAATDGLGTLLGGAAEDTRLQGVRIPPGAGTLFHVGLRAVDVVEGVEANPRTGQLEYSRIREEVGVLGTPDSVTVESGQLRVIVDTLLEAGYDHSGRQVRIWLIPVQEGGPGPSAVDPGAAIVTGTVTYAGGHNSILVDPLEQAVPSTTASDYAICLVGPRVTRKDAVNLTGESGTVFLAEVTSVAADEVITTITHTGQAVHTDFMAFVQEFLEFVGGHAKVAVRAAAADAETPQLSVIGTDGATRVFQVDEDGDVACRNLTVSGTEIVSITEVVTGDAEIGDDPAADTMDVWAKVQLRPGTKGGSAPHSVWSDLCLGDGTEATPGNRIRFDGASVDLEVVVAANGSANDLLLRRNDAEAGESQVVVKNAGAGGRLGLKVQGDLTLGIGPGATGPAALLASNVNSWRLRNESGGFSIAVDDATDRAVTIANVHATGKATLSVEGALSAGGDLTLSGASAKVQATGSGVPLTFDDDVLSAPIPLSSATELGGTALPTASQSLLGAIAEIQSISNNVRHAGVFSLNGLLATDQGSRVCRISAGIAWVEGKKLVIPQTDLTIPSSSTAYLYITSSGAIAQTGTKATAFASDTLPLAVVTTNSSAITGIDTIRAGVPRVTQRVSITVGKGLADNRVCDFATLGEAFRWVKHWQSRIDALGRPEVEIVCVGAVDCTGEVIMVGPEHSGLLVRGARKSDLAALGDGSGYQSAHGETRILWGANDGGVHKLFKVTDVSENVGSIRFRDLVFVYSAGADATNRLFGHESTAQPIGEVAFDGCRFTYTGTWDPDTVLYVASSATIDRVRFRDCRVWRKSSTLAPAIDVQGTVIDGKVLDCRFGRDAAPGTSANELLLNGDWFVGWTRIGPCNLGIRAQTITGLEVVRCTFTGVTSRGVWAGAGENRFVRNRVTVVGGGEELGGLRSDGGITLFSGNTVSVSGASSSSYARGIESLGGGAARARILGNHVSLAPSFSSANNAAIYNSANNVAIQGNVVAASNGDGIKSIGANCTIVGNIASGSGGTIVSSGDYGNVQGNTADVSVTVTGTGSVSSGGGNIIF